MSEEQPERPTGIFILIADGSKDPPEIQEKIKAEIEERRRRYERLIESEKIIKEYYEDKKK